MQLKISVTAISAIGLLFLGACGCSNQPTSPASPANSPMATSSPQSPQATSRSTPKTTNAKTGEEHQHGGQGGQVLESGPYHLELVTSKKSAETHIDLFLQKGDNHEPIPDAKVAAEVQLPDGSQRSLPMKYDSGKQHYTAILPDANSGEYKVAILSDIKGEKINGRFTFRQ